MRSPKNFLNAELQLKQHRRPASALLEALAGRAALGIAALAAASATAP